MNRTLKFSPQGGVVLRSGRLVRALCIVTGVVALEDLEDELARLGFAREALLSAPPDEWARTRPPDWPEEPEVDLAVNECLVRVMGPFEGPAVAFERDMPIGDSGATFTLCGAWEVVQALGEPSAGAAAPPQKPEARSSAAPVLLTAAGLLGIGLLLNHRAEQRAQREQARMRAAIEKEESRARELEREGIASGELDPAALDDLAFEEARAVAS